MHRPTALRVIAPLALAAAAVITAAAQELTLPNAKDALKIAVIGDSGPGSSAQFQVAEKLIAARNRFPYELVLMMGDNPVHRQRAQGLPEEVRAVQAAARFGNEVLRDAWEPRQPERALLRDV